MTELLENSDNTNADTGVSESPSNEATISLAAVQALADALQKIESYTPTVWVDNESPDIDAAHLNKAEQAIMRVTTAMNSAVDVIKDLQSQVNTTNNNLSNRFKVEIITDLNQITKTGWYSGGNIAQIKQYIPGGWNIINATVQDDKSARISVFNKQGLVLEVNRDSDNSYTYFPLALKSDLTDIIVEKGFQKSVDIPAGNAYATIECDIEYTVPSGYKALDIVRGIVPNATCCVYNVYLTGGKARLIISNLNGSRKNVTAYAFILFIKS
jgi:hypothetical protein